MQHPHNYLPLGAVSGLATNHVFAKITMTSKDHYHKDTCDTMVDECHKSDYVDGHRDLQPPCHWVFEVPQIKSLCGGIAPNGSAPRSRKNSYPLNFRVFTVYGGAGQK